LLCVSDSYPEVTVELQEKKAAKEEGSKVKKSSKGQGKHLDIDSH